MRVITILLSAGSVFGFLAAAEAPRKDPAETEKLKLWAAISVNEPVLDWDVFSKPSFVILFGLVNDGNKTVDPHIGDSKLLINGKEYKDWAFTIANGPRDDRWNALPPGDNLSFAVSMGDHFKDAGIYKLQWKGKAFQSPEFTFRVMPRKKK